MEKNSFERAKSLADWAERHMSEVVEHIRYRTKSINLKGCFGSLSEDHLTIGIYNYFVAGGMASLKQHLHVASKLRLAAIALDSFQQRYSVGREIFYALFSDNPDLVKTMAHLEPPEFVSGRANPLSPLFIVHMWQLAIQGDDAALEAKIDKLAKNGRKPDRALAAQGKDFFSLLIQRDKSGLEALIQQEAKTKTDDPLIEDFMSYFACFATKVCWLRGIEVHIDSPLVPMELMPIQPLDHYDDVYDFLQPGWQPPKQGMIEKLQRWYRHRQQRT